MSNASDESKKTATPELARVAEELATLRGQVASGLASAQRDMAAVKVAMQHAANTMLAVYKAEQRIEKMVSAFGDTSERIERKVDDHGKALAVALAKMSDVEDAVEDAVEDITGQHHLVSEGVAARPESIELGPAKVPVRVLQHVGRGLPWILIGFVLAAALMAIALWKSGDRLEVQPSARTEHHQ